MRRETNLWCEEKTFWYSKIPTDASYWTGAPVKNPRINQRQLFEDFTLGLEPVRLAPLAQHVLLKREQIFLRVGKNDDGHYLRRWRAAANCARDCATEIPLPCMRSFSPKAMIFRAAISDFFAHTFGLVPIAAAFRSPCSTHQNQAFWITNVPTH